MRCAISSIPNSAVKATAVLLALLLAAPAARAQEAAPTAAATLTPDRLAPPPTVPSPTLADEGAQLFWLHCQPCHGDQGQGLTDEWRGQFPPEEQDCWQSGCHGTVGKDPPPEGFVLPTAVPAVIGPGSLSRFDNAAQLNAFIQAAMPYEDPGRLTADEYLALTAYLARAHGAAGTATLGEADLAAVRFGSPALDPPAIAGQDIDASLPQATRGGAAVDRRWLLGGGGIVLALLLAAGLSRRHGRRP